MYLISRLVIGISHMLTYLWHLVLVSEVLEIFHRIVLIFILNKRRVFISIRAAVVIVVWGTFLLLHLSTAGAPSSGSSSFETSTSRFPFSQDIKFMLLTNFFLRRNLSNGYWWLWNSLLLNWLYCLWLWICCIKWLLWLFHKFVFFKYRLSSWQDSGPFW